MPASPEPAPDQPDFPGVVTSRRTKVLVADFPGQIQRLFVHSNQPVKAGDPIARLDDAELKQQVEAARQQENAARADAGAAGAQASAAAQKLRLERRLADHGISAIQSVRNVQAELSSLGATAGGHAARARASKADRERLEQLLGKALVAAPFDGVVMMVKVKEGETPPKGAPLVRLYDPTDLMMRFAVPRDRRDAIRVGQRVELRIDGTARPIWATVERIADEEPPINFAVVEADIDDRKLAPDEIRVTSQGRVRIADAAPGGNR